MNFLTLFVLVPLLMIVGLWLSRNIKQIRGVMVAGSTLLLVLAGVLTYMYLTERGAGNTAEMLFRSDIMKNLF